MMRLPVVVVVVGSGASAIIPIDFYDARPLGLYTIRWNYWM